MSVDHAAPDVSAPHRGSALPLLLLCLEPVDQALLQSVVDDRRFAIVRASSLSPYWSAFAQRAGALLIVTTGEPLAALDYARGCGAEGMVIVAAARSRLLPVSALLAARGIMALGLPATPDDLDPIAVALGNAVATVRADSVLQLVLDPIARIARSRSLSVALTQREFAILDCLARQPGQPVTTATLIRYTTNPHASALTRRSLDVHVCHLRKKLQLVGMGDSIRTCKGLGYVLTGRDVPAQE